MEKDEFYLSLQENLGIDKDEKLDEDTLLGKVKTIVENQKTEEDTKLIDGHVALTEENGTLKEQVSVLEANKGEKKKDLDPDILDQLVEAGESALQKLVDACKITPATQIALSTMLIGEVGSRNSFMLSRSISGTDASILSKLIKIFDGNDVVALHEETLAQESVALSRKTPGDDTQLTDDDVTRRDGLLDKRVERAMGKHKDNK